jgi:predicted HTH transcriptional regulator
MVLKGENEILEFKRKANFPEKIVKEVVAFANTNGGNLLIGVDDDGGVTGIKNKEEDLYILNQAIKKYCIPEIDYKIDIVPLNEKRAILNYSIYESKHKPHFVIESVSGNKKKAYLRVKDRSIQASREMIQILKKQDLIKDQKVYLGQKEKILMNYLGQYNEITLSQFSKIATINNNVASKTLVWLVLANILEIEAREDEDIYRQKNG